ncbi:cystatin-C-like [Eptesicus fuscus]|uniref:cystatin-C-like n=1 Tax=Eptesicus fuscus TaxID=29078 RepID=UPI00046B7F9F|nr:cystatin-C-like [Eptesicus fuscus]
MAGLSRAPLFLLALALALALTVSPAAGANAGRPRLVGGLAEADVNEEGVQQALNFALSEYNKASNDAYHSRAMRVVRARKQLVAGLNYFLDVEIGRTTCTKSQPNLANCPFHEQPNLKKAALCSFQIYTVPWLGKTSLVKSSCQDA